MALLLCRWPDEAAAQKKPLANIPKIQYTSCWTQYWQEVVLGDVTSDRDQLYQTRS